MFCKSENLDTQDFKFLNILEDLLKLFVDVEKLVEKAEEKTNDSTQNKTSVITDESRLSGYLSGDRLQFEQ